MCWTDTSFLVSYGGSIRGNGPSLIALDLSVTNGNQKMSNSVHLQAEKEP